MTAGLVLAAGAGRRYGGPKALVHRDGALLVEHAVITARAGGLDPVYVVVGAAAERVRAEADLGDAVLVDNPDWETGMGSSLRVGLTALAATGATAAAVLLVDMPGITPEAVARVTAAAGPGTLAMGGYADRRGHPVVLGRDHWAGVVDTATGDAGARAYLRAHDTEVTVVPCGDVADDTDLDTPDNP
ncbi:4-diphosphocytidyl-2C-methyl-D-erythritol synthase [Asanoa ishikariensis]|uniref:Nicotine blue oxidoreductase n=1 Tax=Asanoa ishikariensis TaxID=137265 RepID=A0A1H3S9H3_9ACTN|nr:nucleotidyltransferase family protein [Asanoa ishikariensis]GIF70350.1 4-diphosphocytidyl-2C-methyl-D-erythritol synthase [Asanoa ishikariensis]SDZ33789.1 nicotine blue oxidoreductase [Asanoa ishikariensis]